MRYTGSRHDILRYSCSRGWMDNGEPRCIAFGGLRVDDAIAAEILRVVEPAAVEAAKQAQRQTLKDRDDVCDALTRDLEAARFAADRAFRQYDAADPDNRLVAAELELRWNRALKRVTDLQQRIDDHERQRPAPTSTIPEDFTSLARDLPAVWADPATDARLKKRLVRTLINEVIADIEPQASEIVLVLHWAGGVHTELRLPRRRRGQRNSTAVEIIEAVRMLVRIADDAFIAGLLNRNKLTTGHGNRWTRERVTALRSHHKISVYSRQVARQRRLDDADPSREGIVDYRQDLTLSRRTRRNSRTTPVIGRSLALQPGCRRDPSGLRHLRNAVNEIVIPLRDMTLANKTSVFQ